MGAADLAVDSLLDLFARFRAGDPSVVGALGGEPVVVVEADAGDFPLLAPPAAFPAVVVAVGGGRLTGTPVGADIAIGRESDGAPWVDGDPSEVVTGVRSSPLASVALAQLLRAGAGRSVEEGLALESLVYSMLQAGPAFASWLTTRRERRVASSDPAGGAAPVRTTRSGDELNVVLDRPHRHNAYDSATRDGLCDALALAVTDDRLAVHLSGEGPSFCSGGDLDEFGTAPDPCTAHLVRTVRSPGRLIAAMSERVSVRLHGWCIGSGIELASFAGTVDASPNALIRLPEIAMGLVPGAGGTVSIPARIGAARTAWLAITGRTIDAGTALRWGLVDSVTDEQEESGSQSE